MLRRVHRRQDHRASSGRRSCAHACPGAGACGGMYTANTMASAIEALGMSLPYSSSTPAEDPRKARRMRRAPAQAIRKLLELRPQAARHHDARRRSRTRWCVVMALGGSTNAVLHLIAMARAVGRAADDRRLPDGQRSRPAARRLQAERQVRDGRPARGRRHAGGDEVCCSRKACSTATA